MLSEEVFSIIENISEPSDIKSLLDVYDEKDQKFLLSIMDMLIDNQILDNPQNERMVKVTFELTNDCNLFCSHCCASANYISKEKMKNYIHEVDLDTVSNIIKLNPDVIILSGGEPLLVKNIWDITEKIFNADIDLVLMTNGTLINQENVLKIVKYFGRVDISIDGITSEECDKIRGKGTYNKVLAGIRLLQENGFKNISLSMAFEVSGKEQQFKEFCESLSVESLIRGMAPVGRALNNHKKVSIVEKFTDTNWACYNGFYNCPGGKSEVVIDETGNIYPCFSYMKDKYKIGNVNIDDTEHLNKMFVWDESLEWFKNFKEYIPEYRKECKDCSVNSFCWSCANVIADLKAIREFDDIRQVCSNKKDRMMEDVWEKLLPFYELEIEE